MITSLVRSVVGEAFYQRLRYARIGRQLRKSCEDLTSKDKHPNLRRATREFWRPYRVRVDPTWHGIYGKFQKTDTPEHFIPDDIFYAHIEPKLNRCDLATAYEDKNNYDALFSVRTPRCPLRNINGTFYDHEYIVLPAKEADARVRELRGDFLIKPALESGGGRLVQTYTFDRGVVRRGGKPVEWAEIGRTYRQDYIVQEVIRQHALLAKYNSPSVNTLRITTLRTGLDCKLVSAFLRIGRAHSCVDNISCGGYACGIHQADGRIADYGISQQLRVHHVHADSGMAFGGDSVPGWNAAHQLVLELHRQLRYFDIVSWDIAIDEEGMPILVELNLRFQDILFHQLCNGPLFGEHTEAVLDRVFEKR